MNEATFVNGIGDGNQIDRELKDAQVEKAKNELPEKYKGKSVDDIVRMHQEAEQLIGRQGAELGEHRKIIDQFIRKTLETPVQAAPEKTAPDKKDSQVDFFADPQKAIAEAVASHPDVQAAKASTETQRRERDKSKLLEKHGDFFDVVGTEAFQKWVLGSPVRTKMYADADRMFDYTVADELVSTFKALNPPAKKPENEGSAGGEKQAEAEASRGATLPRGTVPTETPAGGEKKIYKRVDLIRLHRTDPKRYAELQPEIMAAYAENRVR